MPSQTGNGGPWRGGATPGSELEVLIRQGQDRLKQIMPSGGPRGVIALAVLALAVLGAWTAYYTVPSDSVAVIMGVDGRSRGCAHAVPSTAATARTAVDSHNARKSRSFVPISCPPMS